MYRVMVSALAGLALTLAFVSSATPSATGDELVRIRTVHDGSAMEGVGVVVGVDRAGGVVEVLTAGALFRRSNGEPAADPVEVTLAGQTTVVQADQLFRPLGEMAGVALVHVHRTLDQSVQPMAIDYSEPALGSVFILAGSEGARRVNVTERVQFAATRLVVGDRVPAGLTACLGAPAISQIGVFGVVIDCAPGRAPVVGLLSTARPFLTRQLAPIPTSGRLLDSPPRFTVAERLVDGPLMTVACDAVKAGEVAVPYQLARNEKTVDASASFLNASSVRLADVTVLELDDRLVRLRFTMVGVPPPPYTVPGTCHEGQALLTIRLNLVVLPPQ